MKQASLHPTGMEPLTRMELAISYVLRSGVVLSAVIILVGTVLFALRQDTGYARVQPHHLTDLLAFHQTQGPGYFPAAIPQVVAGTLTGKPYAIIGLGMLLLIATPVIRVALSIFFFLAQGDWLYVGITLFVLAILILSFFAGVG